MQLEMVAGKKAWMRWKVAGENMQNDVWQHGGAGRGPKMDIVANNSEYEPKTAVKQKQTQTEYVQDKAAIVYGV